MLNDNSMFWGVGTALHKNKLSAGFLALVLGLGGALEVSWVAQWVSEGPSYHSLGQNDFSGFVDVDPDSSVLIGRLKSLGGEKKGR